MPAVAWVEPGCSWKVQTQCILFACRGPSHQSCHHPPWSCHLDAAAGSAVDCRDTLTARLNACVVESGFLCQACSWVTFATLVFYFPSVKVLGSCITGPELLSSRLSFIECSSDWLRFQSLRADSVLLCFPVKCAFKRTTVSPENKADFPTGLWLCCAKLCLDATWQKHPLCSTRHEPGHGIRHCTLRSRMSVTTKLNRVRVTYR